jgi:hypothetical protein
MDGGINVCGPHPGYILHPSVTNLNRSTFELRFDHGSHRTTITAPNALHRRYNKESRNSRKIHLIDAERPTHH